MGEEARDAPEGSTPRVSVIVPVYNVEKYLRQCIESLVGQTLREIEIICVDDGSTDGCAAILSEYAARDTRVRVITQLSNRGNGAARNVGMAAAGAPYIMFCDSDDWYERDACERMSAMMNEADDTDQCICRHAYRNELGEKLQEDDADREDVREGRADVKDLRQFYNTPCGKIFKRSIIAEYALRFPEGLLFEDGPFSEAYLTHCRYVYMTEAVLYNYRRRPGSIMWGVRNRRCARLADHYRGCDYLLEHYKKWGLTEEKRTRFWLFVNHYIPTIFQYAGTQERKRIADEGVAFIRRWASETNLRDIPPLREYARCVVRKCRLHAWTPAFYVRQTLKKRDKTVRYDEKWYLFGVKLLWKSCKGGVTVYRLFGLLPIGWKLEL